MTSLLLVRHAQSTWNASGRWQGRSDPPLSPHGEAQARTAALRLRGVDAVVTSPLERARRTATVIASALGTGPVLVDEDLAERDVGPWSGRTTAEIDAGWPGALAERRFPPGFELDDQLVVRARRALARICSGLVPGPAARVLVVTHGGLLLALERDLGAPSGRYPNLAGRWVHVEGEGIALGEQVALVEPTGGTWRPTAPPPPLPLLDAPATGALAATADAAGGPE